MGSISRTLAGMFLASLSCSLPRAPRADRCRAGPELLPSSSDSSGWNLPHHAKSKCNAARLVKNKVVLPESVRVGARRTAGGRKSTSEKSLGQARAPTSSQRNWGSRHIYRSYHVAGDVAGLRGLRSPQRRLGGAVDQPQRRPDHVVEHLPRVSTEGRRRWASPHPPPPPPPPFPPPPPPPLGQAPRT